jgi:hypothetical protein
VVDFESESWVDFAFNTCPFREDTESDDLGGLETEAKLGFGLGLRLAGEFEVGLEEVEFELEVETAEAAEAAEAGFEADVELEFEVGVEIEEGFSFL